MTVCGTLLASLPEGPFRPRTQAELSMTLEQLFTHRYGTANADRPVRIDPRTGRPLPTTQ